MNSKQTSSADKKRLRRTKTALGVAMLFVVGVFGSFFYLQHQAASNNYPKRELVGGQLDPDVFAATRKAQIARAQELRAKWQPWAQTHQAELKRMLHASPNDRAVLTAVWNALPTNTSEGDSAIPNKELLSGVGAPWSWSPQVKDIDNVIAHADTDSQKQLLKAKAYRAQQVIKNFSARRDVIMSEPIPNGPSKICLWASGRITDEQWVLNPQRGRGKSSFVPKSEEIESSFDFLR